MEARQNDWVDADDETTWPGSTAGARVLVAEDDQAMLELLIGLLRMQGHNVTPASDGNEMLELLAKTSVSSFPDDAFDLIVTDLRMPGCTGLDAIERLRNVGYGTPVIVITAFPNDSIRRRAEHLETVLVAKPFGLDELRVAVEASLKLARQQGVRH